jgi:hypothetical protein
MDGDPPADLASERCRGNVAWCPPKHQESSVAFARNTLDTPENAAVVFAAQDFHGRADREIAHGTPSAATPSIGLRWIDPRDERDGVLTAV